MHAALEVQESARPEPPARTPSSRVGARWALGSGEAWLWLAVLLVIVSLSQADSLLADVVPYERDTAVFYFPLMSWVAEQLHAGQFPLWTPQFFGGYPIFADGEIGLAYPPALLALLALPTDRAFITLRVAHVCLAAAGMFVLARAWRLPYPSAVLAGLVFALGSFPQAQIHHENIVRTASWLPMILALVEHALRSDTRTRQLRWTALAALALGMAGLSLHSQLLAMDLLTLAAYGALRWAIGPVRSSWRLMSTWLARFCGVATVCLPVVVGGLGIAAVQLVPLVELAGFSARGNGIPYSQAAAYSVTPYGLIQLIFPYFFRGPGNFQWGLWTHWESYLFIGLTPLVLALVALVCVRQREIAGWATIGGLGLVLSLGQYSPMNLHYFLWLVPGLNGLRAPGRFTFVVILAAAMLAASGLAWLMSDGPRAAQSFSRLLRRLSIAFVALVVGVVLVNAAVLVMPDALRGAIQSAYLALPRDTYSLTTDDVLRGLQWSTNLTNPRLVAGLVGLAVVIGCLWLWQFSTWRSSRLWPGVLIGLTAIDLLVFGWGIHPREPLSRISAEPPAVRVVEQLPSVDAAPNRMLDSPVLNQVAADRLAPFGSAQEANGYSSLQFIWHRDYLDRVLYADDALLDLWGVRYIFDPAQFGTLAEAGGVQYLPQQALLHAPAGSGLSEQRFALTGGSPLAEIRFVTALMGAVEVPQGALVAQVELRDAADQLVGTLELQAGRDTMEWAYDVPSVQANVKHARVASAGTTNEAGGSVPTTRELSFADFSFATPVIATTLTVRAVPPVGEFVLYGAAAIGSDGSVDQLFGKTKTKYRQVYLDDEIRVVEDTAAFPRAFIVPRARVAPSLGTALSEMVHQPFQPNDEVILADDSATQAAGVIGDRGGHGTAVVTSYSANAVSVSTSTAGDAWLVLSDTYYPGWTATVDGQPTTVLRGDVLFRVLPLPTGEHDVELRFEPTNVRIGAAISLAALLLIGAALLLAGRSIGQSRTT